MIVADASALLAIILREDDAPAHRSALFDADGFLISVVNAWETSVRAERNTPGMGAQALDVLLDRFGGEVVAVDTDGWRAALTVWGRFGRDNHPAQLNLGDCFAYALAESRGLPLLYKGKDFPQTDIASVL